jgi:hypothetical protein
MDMPPSDAPDPQYQLEWRRTAQRSMLIPAIKSHSAGATLDSNFLICGGKGADQFSDIWRFLANSLEWERIEINGSEVPPPRDGHSLTKVSESKFIVFGGQGNLLDSGVTERGTENGKVKYLAMRKLHDDMYEFDCNTLSWTFLPRRKIRPLARRGHVMKYLKPGTRLRGYVTPPEDELPTGLGHLLLFGGSCLDLSTGFEKAANDVWLYHLESQMWEEVVCDGALPHPMYGHCGEIVGDSLIIVGGIRVPKRDMGGGKRSVVCWYCPITCFECLSDKSKPQKKRRGDELPVVKTGMSASEIELLGSGTVSVLDLTSFHWQSLPVDCSSLPPGFSGRGLNLVGHSIVPSPLEKEEIYIFGGRRNDERAFQMRRSEHIPANLLSLNTTTMKLTVVPVTNAVGDTTNVPEARLNQTCQMILSERVPLSEEAADEKPPARKGKNNRRPPFMPVKRPPLVPHPMVRIYGGSKLYEAGFCPGQMYDLFFIPLEKKDILSRMESSSISRQNEDNSSVQNSLDNITNVRPLTVRKQSTMEIAIAAQNESGCGEVFHMLNLKDDSTVRLLSPTRGVSGQYFMLKTSLSRSRSTFSRPGSSREPSPHLPEVASKRPVSAPMMNSMSMTSLNDASALDGRVGDMDTLSGSPSFPSEGSSSLTQKSRVKLERERIKQMGSTLSPVTRGLTVHDARDVFNKIYPLPSSRSRIQSRSFSPTM